MSAERGNFARASTRARLVTTFLSIVAATSLDAKAQEQDEPPLHPTADVDRREFLDGRFYVEQLQGKLLEHHPTLAEVTKEQFTARALVALEQSVREDAHRLDHTGLTLDALQGAHDWNELVKQWLPRGVADSDPEVDARVALLADAMLDAVGDRFTRLIRGDHVLNLGLALDLTIPNEMGVGVRRRDGGFVFDAVVRDSDAWWKGLRSGDRLLAVNGVAVAPLSPREVERRLATPSTLTVTRDGFAEPVELAVESFAVTHGTLGALVAPDVGWLAFQLFEQGGFVSLVHAVTTLRERGAKAFVLDLRGNPGGAVVECQTIASLFLPDGAVVANIDERGTPKVLPEKLLASRPRFPDPPLVLLVDGGSASASEMLAAALQDAGRARLVGEPTFGKAIGQALHYVAIGGERATTGLPRADLLVLTTLRFSSPKGRDHHDVGVLPDVRVPPWPRESRERLLGRVRLLGSNAFAEALLDAELSDADVASLRVAGPAPAALEKLAASFGLASRSSDENEALKDVARIAQRGAHPDLAACPALDPALATAIEEAEKLLAEKR